MSIFSEYKTLQQLLAVRHSIVVYAESRHYYQYFKDVIIELLKTEKTGIVYITSDKNDPLLLSSPAGMRVFYVYWWLPFLFQHIKAAVVITSMTDLNNYAFKRSKTVRNYVYVFHAAVSTHLQYTQKAFFHYDAIFATGPYQEAEIRAAEKIHHLSAKRIIHYGYPIIDMLKNKAAATGSYPKEKPSILIAPSWFNGCIFDTCINELVQELLQLHYQLIIRPHPEYTKRRKKESAGLLKLAANNAQISFDYSANITESLLQADVLITDRSGIAMEYALGIERPVLFIETIPKIMNPDWAEIGIEPLENQIRSDIGVIVSIEEISQIDKKIDELKLLHASFPEKMALLREKILFNHPGSVQAGVEYITGCLH